eukprot:1729555-Amphidinium_carterae.1
MTLIALSIARPAEAKHQKASQGVQSSITPTPQCLTLAFVKDATTWKRQTIRGCSQHFQTMNH